MSDKCYSGWKTMTLEEATEVIIDYRGKTPVKVEKGIPLITAKIVKNGKIETPTEFIATEDYEKWMTRGFPQKGDIVLTTEAPLGEVAQLEDEKIALAQRIVTLRGKEGILSNDYFLYLLQTKNVQAELEARSSGSTVKGIKQSQLRKILLTFPPYEEQLKKTAILKNIDCKIELNNQINETLEQMAKALFKSWFVDFEPVLAKAEAVEAGNDPELAAMQVISGKSIEELGRFAQSDPEAYQELAHTASLFPSEFVESELGMIPMGWEVKKIEEIVIRYPVGQKYSQKEIEQQGFVPVLDQSSSGVIGYHNNKIDIPASRATPIMTFANHTCCLRLVMIGFSVIQNVLPFQSTEDIYWTYCGVQGKQKFQEYKGHWPDFVGQNIIVPKRKISDFFGKTVREFFIKIQSRNEENQSLQLLRDTLLPKLLSGEIEI